MVHHGRRLHHWYQGLLLRWEGQGKGLRQGQELQGQDRWELKDLEDQGKGLREGQELQGQGRWGLKDREGRELKGRELKDREGQGKGLRKGQEPQGQDRRELKDQDLRGRDPIARLDLAGLGVRGRHCCGSFIHTASDLLNDGSNNQWNDLPHG